MFKYRKVLLFVNRAVYLMSAVMMIAGLFLTVTTKPVSAADKIYWCHCEPNGNCQTLHLPQEALENAGHVDASGNALHAGDYGGECIVPSATPENTATNTTVPVGDTPVPDTATPTEINTPIDTPTNTPTEIDTPTNTPTNTATATFTDTPTNTATATFTDTPTNTATATFTNTPTDTNTPTNTPNTLYVILQDPYCVSIPGTLMQWAVVNNNAGPFTVDSWSIDGAMQAAGFIAPVGVSLLTQTSLGTHTIALYWEQEGSTSLEFTIAACALPDTATPTPTNTTVPVDTDTPTATNTTVPVGDTPVPDTATPVPTLPIPETGGSGGPIIPVTGADLTQPINGWFFGGFGMFGFGMILTGLRKMFDL